MDRLNKVLYIDPHFSANDWELYLTDEKGAAEAAERLNAALKESVNHAASRRTTYNAMYAAMVREAAFGASDSEPFRFLRAVLNEIYGYED